MNKIQSAQAIIKQALEVTKHPVVCCSFGKDSTAMLAMVQDECPKVDVLFLPETEMHHKNLHAYNAAVAMNTGKLYSYPATYIDYVQKDEYFEVLKYHYVDGRDWYVLYNGCRQYRTGEEFLCVKKELLSSYNLVSSYAFPWDCVFHGQKEIDAVYFTESYRFSYPITKFGRGVLATPLYNWTDEEALNYVALRKLPVQTARYKNNPSGLSTGNLKQDYISSDVIPVCFSCLDYRNKDKEIICPKTNEKIDFCGRSKEVHEQTLKNLLKVSNYKEV